MDISVRKMCFNQTTIRKDASSESATNHTQDIRLKNMKKRATESDEAPPHDAINFHIRPHVNSNRSSQGIILCIYSCYSAIRPRNTNQTSARKAQSCQEISADKKQPLNQVSGFFEHPGLDSACFYPYIRTVQSL